MASINLKEGEMIRQIAASALLVGALLPGEALSAQEVAKFSSESFTKSETKKDEACTPAHQAIGALVLQSPRIQRSPESTTFVWRQAGGWAEVSADCTKGILIKTTLGDYTSSPYCQAQVLKKKSDFNRSREVWISGKEGFYTAEAAMDLPVIYFGADGSSPATDQHRVDVVDQPCARISSSVEIQTDAFYLNHEDEYVHFACNLSKWAIRATLAGPIFTSWPPDSSQACK